MNGPKRQDGTPGYVRYSGYDTQEEEDEFLSILGPVWCDGDPLPAEEYARGVRVPTKGAV